MGDEGHRTVLWILTAALVALGGGTGASAAAPDPCAAWAGEPRPLPNVADSDPLRARWAELRVRELSQRAWPLEATAAVEAHRLWRRVLCLDPENHAAWEGIARTRPVRIHRPRVIQTAPARAGSGDPWAQLDRPIALHVTPPPVPSEPPARAREAEASEEPLAETGLVVSEVVVESEAGQVEEVVADEVFQQRVDARVARIASLLEQADDQLSRARFEQALGTADQARERLAALAPRNDLVTHWVRLHVLTATAQIALGENRAAQQSLAEALTADPRLRLDPTTTSPRVLRALDVVRGGQQRRP